MSEHNAKVLRLLCERAGWGLEHVRQLPVPRQGGRGSLARRRGQRLCERSFACEH